MIESIQSGYEIISFPKYTTKKLENKVKKKRKPESDYYIFIDDYKPNKPLVFLDDIDETIYRADLNHYLQEITKSYKCDNKKMLFQFHNDYNRNLIYINNKRVLSAEDFLYYIEYKFPEEMNIIVMLFTQATMGFPFEMIQGTLKENFYLGELCKQERSYPMKLNLKIKENNFKIKISKKLRIFELNDDLEATTVRKINVKLYIDLSDEYIIIKILKI